ncbi:MAG: nucleotide exchange factor GrpE [Chloroflexi bacterium]|nr:nucleotide exchange factor GrpE [Chloroflexota bacterium]
MSEKKKDKDEIIEEEQVVEPTEGDVAPEEEAAEAEPLSIEERLTAAQAEAAHNLDGWMRAQAEFANARKRMEKQRADTYLNATSNVATKLLPVIDDFERAMDNVPDEIAENGWLEGVQMAQRKLINILDGLKVKPIEALGQPFDPMFHEAIMQEPTDEYESGVVSKELQKGYQIGDRVIRPSLVYVAE